MTRCTHTGVLYVFPEFGLSGEKCSVIFYTLAVEAGFLATRHSAQATQGGGRGARGGAAPGGHAACAESGHGRRSGGRGPGFVLPVVLYYSSVYKVNNRTVSSLHTLLYK